MKTRRNTAAVALVLVVAMFLVAGCASGSVTPEEAAVPNVMPTVTAQDTTFAERATMEQALLPVAYDVKLSLDTKADRLTERVTIKVRNAGKKKATAAYLRFNPLGYFAYAEQQRPDEAEANKGAWAIDPPAYDSGENRNPARADFHVSVKAPAEYKVAAAGIESEGDGTTVFAVKDARDVGLVVCNFMDVDEYEAEGVPVRVYYLKTGEMDAYRALEPQFVKDTFAELTRIVGPYERDSYTIVQGVEGGMEYSGFAVVSGLSFVEGKADDYNKAFRNTVHEVAHSWFYDAVGNVEYREGWIDEGFTTYLASDMALMNADLPSWELMQSYSKENPTGASYQTSRTKVNERMGVKPLEGREHCILNRPYLICDEGDEPGDKEYIYAPTFLSRVRAAMGDEKFDAFLKDVYKTCQGKVATTERILKLLRAHDDSDEVEKAIAFFFAE